MILLLTVFIYVLRALTRWLLTYLRAKMYAALKIIIKRCEICQKNNLNWKASKNWVTTKWKVSFRGTGEIDFTHIPKSNWFSYLQVLVDTFTGWAEAFLCCSEQAQGSYIKFNPWNYSQVWAASWGLQRDNGSSFKAVVTQGVSKVLGIECHLEIPIFRKGRKA